jgi:hypothetical protein
MLLKCYFNVALFYPGVMLLLITPKDVNRFSGLFQVGV